MPEPPPVPGSATGVAVLVLADDLIWASRLADAVTASGALPLRVRRVADLEARLAEPDAPSAVVVDLTARAYDGVEAVRRAGAGGARVAAVGQHDDTALRRRAIDAGAERVFTYRAMHEDGARLMARWLGA